jgi:hypothetical protein
VRGGGEQAVLGFFHEGDDLLSFHGGKPFQKIINRIARPQIIEQRLNRHARTSKAGCAAHHVAVNTDDSSLLHSQILRQTDSETKAGCDSIIPPSAPSATRRAKAADLYATRAKNAPALIKELEAAKSEIIRLYARWEELDQIGK